MDDIKKDTTLQNVGKGSSIAPLVSTLKNATIHDVAANLGVSATTVWRALNNKPRVSNKTRERVLKEAKGLNYRPSMVAQTLRRQKTDIIGVVVPMIGNTAYSFIVRAIEQLAFEKGYNILLCDTDIDVRREKAYIDLLIRRRVEGVVVIPLAKRKSGEFDHLFELEFNNIPVVVIEQEIPSLPLNQIVVDNCAGAKCLMKHLVNLGHQRIAFFHAGLPEWDFVQSMRFKGYKSALEEFGLNYDPALVLQVARMTVDESQSLIGREVLEKLIKSRGRPTAIFAYCDGVAIKTLRLLRKIGIKVPDDIAVIGFDDVNFASDVNPSLTTYKQPTKELGHRAAEFLFKRFESGIVSSQKLVHEKIEGELVIRESCGAKKER